MNNAQNAGQHSAEDFPFSATGFSHRNQICQIIKVASDLHTLVLNAEAKLKTEGLLLKGSLVKLFTVMIFGIYF